MTSVLGWGLVFLGGIGVVARSVTFVRVTMPANYGRNPGFGAYEASALPWWILGAVGVGLVSSVRAGLVAGAAGIVVLSVLAHALGHLFGRR
jgi:hypothetical protein